MESTTHPPPHAPESDDDVTGSGTSSIPSGATPILPSCTQPVASEGKNEEDLLEILKALVALRSSPARPSSEGVHCDAQRPVDLENRNLLGFCGVERVEDLPPIWSEVMNQSSARSTGVILARHFAKARKQDPRIDFAPKLNTAKDIQNLKFWHSNFDTASLCRGMTPFAFFQNGPLSVCTGDLFMSALATYTAAIRILFGTHCQLYSPLNELLESFSSRMGAIRAVGLRYPGWYTKALLLICQESRAFYRTEQRGATCTMQDSTKFLKLCITMKGTCVIPNSMELLPRLKDNKRSTTCENPDTVSKKRGPQDVADQDHLRKRSKIGNDERSNHKEEEAPSWSSLLPDTAKNSSQYDKLKTPAKRKIPSLNKPNKRLKADQEILKRRSANSPQWEPLKRPRYHISNIDEARYTYSSHYMVYDDPDL